MPSSELVTPWSARLSLSETVQRLRARSEIVGISYLGSTGTARWSEASDYDLLLLMSDYPSGFGVEATIVRVPMVLTEGLTGAISGRLRRGAMAEQLRVMT